MEPEHKRFMEKTITEGRRNGLHLAEEQREEVSSRFLLS